MRRIFLSLIGATLLAACGEAPTATPTVNRAGPVPMASAPLPAMKTFRAAPASAPRRANAEIAQDFMDLSFRLESGRALPVLTRFEGPISLRVVGPASGALQGDLTRLLARLRSEAGIPITQVPASAAAAITIEVIPGGEMQRLVPHAACFVAPRVTSWSAYKRNRRSDLLDWTTLRSREHMAIFLPAGTSPQETRDCLHEELAQALGPLNDLYRLPDSVFNDDNFHTVLTGFDMLILRAYYAPEMHSGMGPEEVAAVLPGLLNRLNPGGAGRGAATDLSDGRAWQQTLQAALMQRSGAARLSAARQAVAMARAAGWDDSRLAFSLFVMGRLSMGVDPDGALAAFVEADAIYRARPETRLQSAHVAMQLSAYALSSGQSEAAIDMVNAALPPVLTSQNAALLASLLMVKSQALTHLGRDEEARAVRLDSLGWARYGFGSDRAVHARMSEIAALRPKS